MSLSIRLFDEFFDFDDELNCLFNHFGKQLELFDNEDSLLADLYETRTDFKVVMDVPGIKKRDIKIDADATHMEINITKKLPHPKAMNFFQRLKDRKKVTITKAIDFPSRIDPSRSTVSLEDGVLTITVSKFSSSSKISLKIN